MERLTDKRMKGDGFIPVDPKEYKAFIKNEKPTGKQIYERLLEIEDILGDEYDLCRLREYARLDVGRYFNLGDGICKVAHDAEGSIYNMVMNRAVEFVNLTDRFLTDAIIERARKNGITDLYVLDEGFIMAAIREKREKETPDYWIPFIPPLSAGNTLYRCPRCGKTSGEGPTPYCPQCGKRLEVRKK